MFYLSWVNWCFLDFYTTFLYTRMYVYILLHYMILWKPITKATVDCAWLEYTSHTVYRKDFLNHYVKLFLCCILCGAGKLIPLFNYFINNFYVNYLNATKFSEIICALIVIVYIKNALSCIKRTLVIRCYLIHSRLYDQKIISNGSVCNVKICIYIYL